MLSTVLMPVFFNSS